MKFRVALMALAIFTGTAAGGQTDTDSSSSYETMREQVIDLYSQERSEEAADILENALDRFPDHRETNLYNLLLCLLALERYGRCVEILDYAFNHGAWFNPRILESEPFAPIREAAEYSTIRTRNDSLRQTAQAASRPAMTVVTPGGYSGESKHPLFIALHGDGGNIGAFEDVWRSDKLSRQFIVAFVQSSQVISMTGFTWENRALAAEEVGDAYRRVIDEYPIDTQQVVIGGFSSGGGVALDVALGDAFPVSGFVVLCPASSENAVAVERIRAARQRGLRGAIITTGRDPRVEEHRKLVELFRTEGLQYQFMTSPETGHWIPDELGVMIDNSLDHILNK